MEVVENRRKPKSLAYDEMYHEDYKSFTSEENPFSPFSKGPNKDIFLYSLALGYFHKKRIPLKTRHNDGVSWSALKEEGEWLIYSIAIMEEKNLEVLLDMKKMVLIAEEYANGGFPYLKEIMSAGSLDASVRELQHDLLNVENEAAKFLEDKKNSEEANKIKNDENKVLDHNEDPRRLIEHIENTFRSLIVRELSLLSKDWLTDRIPFDPNNNLVEKWKRNQQRDLTNYNLFRKNEEMLPLIHYSDLGELISIIKWTKNWDQCFKNIFEDKSIFENDMKQLLWIRNDIAHSRPLNETQLTKLQAIVKHSLSLIETSKRKYSSVN